MLDHNLRFRECHGIFYKFLGNLLPFLHHSCGIILHVGTSSTCLLMRLYMNISDIWSSLFGSFSIGSYDVVFFGITDFRISPILMHGVEFYVSVTTSLWILGNHMRSARGIILDWHGLFLCIDFFISFEVVYGWRVFCRRECTRLELCWDLFSVSASTCYSALGCPNTFVRLFVVGSCPEDRVS